MFLMRPLLLVVDDLRIARTMGTTRTTTRTTTKMTTKTTTSSWTMCGIMAARREPARLQAVDVLLTMKPNMQLKGADTRLVLAILMVLDTTTATWAIGTLIAVGGGKVTLLALRMSVSNETTPIIETTHTIFTLIGHGLVAIGGVASLLYRLMIATCA
jgi:hypothetical protein